MLDRLRTLRDSRAVLVGTFLATAIATIPLGQFLRDGLASLGEPGFLVTASWAGSASLLAGFLLVQYLGGVPDVREYRETHEDPYYTSFLSLRAFAKHAFAVLLAGVWLTLLAVVAPLVDVPMLVSLPAGLLGLTGVLVTFQPLSGPDLYE